MQFAMLFCILLAAAVFFSCTGDKQISSNVITGFVRDWPAKKFGSLEQNGLSQFNLHRTENSLPSTRTLSMDGYASC